jgi:hypothetical protein
MRGTEQTLAGCSIMLGLNTLAVSTSWRARERQPEDSGGLTMHDSSTHGGSEPPVGSPGGCVPAPGFGVSHEAGKFRFSGAHYDRLVQAVSGDKADSAEPGLSPGTGDHAIKTPSDTDRLVMSVLYITYEAGVYGHEGFHCDNLADAVTYAYLRRHTQGLGSSW